MITLHRVLTSSSEPPSRTRFANKLRPTKSLSSSSAIPPTVQPSKMKSSVNPSSHPSYLEPDPTRTYRSSPPRSTTCPTARSTVLRRNARKTSLSAASATRVEGEASHSPTASPCGRTGRPRLGSPSWTLRRSLWPQLQMHLFPAVPPRPLPVSPSRTWSRARMGRCICLKMPCLPPALRVLATLRRKRRRLRGCSKRRMSLRVC